MNRFVVILSIFVLLYSCGKGDDAPPVPEGANLIFPNENSECTTGVSVNNTLSQVTFEWSASANTDTYTLSVVNLETNIPQTISTAATSASLSIEKGTPFSWSVTSRNSNTDQIATSDTWLFYNAGSQTNYAPFPAQVVNPVSGSTVQKSLSNEVTLEWSGSDVEDDIESFEFMIFDRWGKLLFRTGNRLVSWDGVYNGEITNTGVYTYYLKYKQEASGEKEVSGNITLMR